MILGTDMNRFQRLNGVSLSDFDDESDQMVQNTPKSDVQAAQALTHVNHKQETVHDKCLFFGYFQKKRKKVR